MVGLEEGGAMRRAYGEVLVEFEGEVGWWMGWYEPSWLTRWGAFRRFWFVWK